MPRTTREWALNKNKMGQNAIQNARKHIEEIASVYKEAHPDISDRFMLVSVILDEAYKMLENIRF